MVRLCFVACIFSLFCGCMANNGLGSMASSEVNIQNMFQLSAGMKQCEVLQIMKKPYKYEKFEIQDETYDVWFYVTKPTILGQSRMVPQNLTPLTFKNGILVGWGFAYYNYLVKKEDSAATRKNPLPSSKPEEDEALEKALQTPPSSSKTSLKPIQPTKPPSNLPPENKQPKQNPPTKNPAPSNAASKASAEKTQAVKTQPSHTNPMQKSKPQTPDPLQDSQFKAPDKTEPRGSPKPTYNVKPTSMSSVPTKPPSQPTAPTKPKKEPKKKPLLDEEDEDMLEDASDQNFNQT